jgi:putative spermidine/putrescine transport system permease protein
MTAKLLRWFPYLGYAVILIPTIFVVGASFTTTRYIVFPPVGFSLKWYAVAFSDPYMLKGLWLSLFVAVTAVLISLVIGTFAALYLTRPRALARSYLSTFFLAPLNVPTVMTAFAILLVFTNWGLINQTGLIIAHVVLTVPYIIRTVMVSLTGMDASLPRAAAILGANPWKVFRYITLPLIKPGMLAGAFFAFLVSFNNVTLSVFITSPGSSTLPVVLFNRMEWLAEPSVAAAASMIVITTIVVMLILDRKFSLFRSLFG